MRIYKPMSPDLILIPTYNEAETIGPLIRQIRVTGINARIIVIDDNSPDGTGEIVRKIADSDPAVSLLERPAKSGLGSAYVEALSKVRQMDGVQNMVTMDADGSHDPAYLQEMFRKLRDYDLVIGSRYVKGGGIEKWEWYRLFLSSLGNLYSRLILRLPIRDLTAGFVGFRRRVLDSLDLSRFDSSGYAYQIEFKYYCIKQGWNYAEIPIIFKERRRGHSKISLAIIVGGLTMPWRLLLRKMI